MKNIEIKDELLEAAKPLMKYLNDNYHPHCKIIVENTMIEVVEGITNRHTTEFLND